MDRCDIGSDGKTRLHSLDGRRDNTLILEFWEKILCMPAKPARGEAGPAFLSWSTRWNAELVVGSSGCHRARVGDQNTCGERQESFCEEEMRCGSNTRNTSSSVVSGWQLQCIRHSSRNGAARGFGARSRGEVLIENKEARTYLRGADFNQWGLSEGCPGCQYLRTGQGRHQAHSQACRKNIESPDERRLVWVRTTGCG